MPASAKPPAFAGLVADVRFSRAAERVVIAEVTTQSRALAARVNTMALLRRG